MSDLISRADAIAYIDRIINSGLGRNKSLDYIHKYISLLPSADAVSCEAIMSAKFHPLPYTHITPTDAEAESYKRGWNDALDAVVDNAPSADAVHIETYRELYEKYVELKHAAEAETKCIAQIKIDADEIVERIKEEYDITDGWIPCSERLPRTGDDLLVTFSDGEVDIVISARPKAWVKYEEANNLIFPVAWMPLPEPYRKESGVGE